jgi:hypothetical protein
MKKYSKVQIDTLDFLTVDGDNLRTSQNLTVPIREARVLFKAYQAGKSIKGAKIGYYSIISVTKDLVTVGCHKIPMAEFERTLGEVS